MSGIATLAGASLDDAPGSIGMPMAAAIGIMSFIPWILDVDPPISAPAGRGVQRHMASELDDRLATNHTSLAHSTSLLMHADRGPKFSADTTQLITTATNRTIATGGSAPKPLGNTARTLTRGCY